MKHRPWCAKCRSSVTGHPSICAVVRSHQGHPPLLPDDYPLGVLTLHALRRVTPCRIADSELIVTIICLLRHNNATMPRTTAPLIPATERLLTALGERLRLARLRRRLPAKQVAERAGMAPKTLRAIERGSPAATLGAYAAVLQVLQLENGLALVAAEDPLGRNLQDKALEGSLKPRRAVRTRTPPRVHSEAATRAGRATPGAPAVGVTSDALMTLLDLAEPPVRGTSAASSSRSSSDPKRRSRKS